MDTYTNVFYLKMDAMLTEPSSRTHLSKYPSNGYIHSEHTLRFPCDMGLLYPDPEKILADVGKFCPIAGIEPTPLAS